MLKRFRLWRIKRSYELIDRLEGLVGVEAIHLRGEFAIDTIGMMNDEQKNAGWSRDQRRRFRRKLLAMK